MKGTAEESESEDSANSPAAAQKYRIGWRPPGGSGCSPKNAAPVAAALPGGASGDGWSGGGCADGMGGGGSGGAAAERVCVCGRESGRERAREWTERLAFLFIVLGHHQAAVPFVLTTRLEGSIMIAVVWFGNFDKILSPDHRTLPLAVCHWLLFLPATRY